MEVGWRATAPAEFSLFPFSKREISECVDFPSKRIRKKLFRRTEQVNKRRPKRSEPMWQNVLSKLLPHFFQMREMIRMSRRGQTVKREKERERQKKNNNKKKAVEWSESVSRACVRSTKYSKVVGALSRYGADPLEKDSRRPKSFRRKGDSAVTIFLILLFFFFFNFCGKGEKEREKR